MLEHEALTNRIIGLAIDVHRKTGPGLLEALYEFGLCREFIKAGIPYENQVPIPVMYDGDEFSLGFRADIVVDKKVIIKIKAVTSFDPAHEAQILTYLRMSRMRIGFLFNFHAPRLKDGMRRYIV